jgi:hypothetical protein
MDLFGNQNIIQINAGNYWIKGGPEASKHVRQHTLEISGNGGVTYPDYISITVIWVDLTGKCEPTDLAPESPHFDGTVEGTTKDFVEKTVNSYVHQMGSRNLGVQRTNSEFGGQWVTTYDGLDPKKDSKWIRVGAGAGVAFTGNISPYNWGFEQKDRNPGYKFRIARLGLNVQAQVDFGFVFKREVNGRIYRQLIEAANQPISLNYAHLDDSRREFQDIDPYLDGDKLLIYDVDGPGNAFDLHAFPGPRYFFAHQRTNFPRQYIAFNYLPNTPERASVNLEWSVSLDTAVNYDKELVFLYTKPNTTKDRNFVQIGKQLDSLDLSLPRTTINNVTALAPVKLKEFVDFKIEGANLVGDYRLMTLDGARWYRADFVGVKEDPNNPVFSQAEESKATFCINESFFKKGDKLKLVIDTIHGRVEKGEFVVE